MNVPASRHRLFQEARRRAELPVQQLWVHYVTLGGTCDVFDVDAFLHGLTVLTPLEQDVLAHALNERLDDLNETEKVPYLTTSPARSTGAEDPLDVLHLLLNPAAGRPAGRQGDSATTVSGAAGAMTLSSLAEAVNAVTRFLVSDVSLQETLDRVAYLAQQAVKPAAAVGITLIEDGSRPGTFMSTADIAPTVDQAQYDDGQGPCLMAYQEARVIRVDDTRQAAGRWPRYSAVAVQAGVFSTLSLPLTVGDETYGAFNMYATTPHAFTEADAADAQRFATQAAVVLGNARLYWGAYELAEHLQTAMRSRAAIEQAKGIIMAGRHCGPDEAFTTLVGASQRSNTKLRDLASRMVDNCSQP